MGDVSIEIASPLRECFLHCEVNCVRECCGINAISTDPDLITAWGRQIGPSGVAEALGQLDNLVTVVKDRSHNVSSLFLNHYTCHEAARRQLLEFLELFRTAIASIAEPAG